MMDKILLAKVDRAKGYAWVRGELVRQVQTALNKNHDAKLVTDSIFGSDTANAVKSWQKQNHKAETGNLSVGDFEALTGQDAPEDFDICLQVTASFEGHDFTLAKGNFDGAILTWGIIGFTFRHGEIQTLIEAFDKNAKTEDTLNNYFDQKHFDKPLSSEFRDALQLNPAQKEAKDWAAKIAVPTNPSKLLPDWREAFEKLGDDPDMRKLQVARAKEKYWKQAVKTAQDLSLTDRQGHALCFDIHVQNGGVSKQEREAIADAIASIGGSVTPRIRRLIIADTVAENSNPKWVEDVRSRKRCLAFGEGTVHKAKYKLEQWGIPTSQQGPVTPKVRPAAAAGPQAQRFRDFFSSLSLKYFQAKEFTFLGSAHNDPTSPAFDLNALPAEDLWPRMVPTARVLERLRADLKAPVRLTSVYRTVGYNAAIKGEPDSQHTQFTAVDFFCSDGKSPEHWASLLHEYRNEGFFVGGIGIYPARQFVHIDTRGENRTFNG